MYLPTDLEAYRTAIRAASRPYNYIDGTITFTDSSVDDIDTANLPPDSITITKQCIDGGDLEFGGVYLTKLQFIVITDRPRYDYYDAKINLTFNIKTGTETVDDVTTDVFTSIPLGVFTVADAERTSNQVKGRKNDMTK